MNNKNTEAQTFLVLLILHNSQVDQSYINLSQIHAQFFEYEFFSGIEGRNSNYIERPGHDIEFAMSITNRYLTSDFASRSMAVLICSTRISSISAVMLCFAQKSNISSVSFMPPMSLPPTSFLPINNQICKYDHAVKMVEK